MLKLYIENDNTFDRDLYYINTCIFVPISLALKIQNINKYNAFISGRGKEIINDFLDNKVTNTKYENWIKELAKNEDEDDYKKKIFDTYYDIFSKQYNYHRFPFFEAISMLGTKLLIEEDNSKK